MLNLLAIEPAQVIRPRKGTTAEVVENVGDGIWLNARSPLASDAGRGPHRTIPQDILRVPETRVAGRSATNGLIFEAMPRRAGVSFRADARPRAG